MDPEQWTNFSRKPPRKVKFAPKAPPRRAEKPVVPKIEKVEDNSDAAQAEELMRRFNESFLIQKPKAEKKGGGSQVAFGFAGSSTSQGGGVGNFYSPYPPTGGGTDNKPKKEYKEPWDYDLYYPTTLPLRPPHSGDPEVLDEEEFGEDAEAKRLAYDENSMKPAVELGLLGENMERRRLFFQLPLKVPKVKEQPKASDSNEASTNAGNIPEAYDLHELPAGFYGKLLVYKSGAVKLKLGDTLFEVQEGVDISCSEMAFTVDENQEVSCSAELDTCNAVVTPDLNYLFGF